MYMPVLEVCMSPEVGPAMNWHTCTCGAESYTNAHLTDQLHLLGPLREEGGQSCASNLMRRRQDLGR